MTEAEAESLRTLTVDVVLALRAEYLSTGASALKHWDQIQDRMRAAARTTASAPEWATAVARSLGLSAPWMERARATRALADMVAHLGATAWLDMVEREHAYVMALARLRAEERKSVRTPKGGESDG